jgi:Phage head maturation protease
VETLPAMSFAFRMLDRRLDDGAGGPEDLPVQTVLDMRVSEVSLVTFPAYPQTDVEVARRSLQEFREAHIYRPSLAMRWRQLKVDQA